MSIHCWTIGIQAKLSSAGRLSLVQTGLDALEDSLFEEGVLIAFEADQSASSNHSKSYTLRIAKGQDMEKTELGLNELAAKLSADGVDLSHWIESFGHPKAFKRGKLASR